MMLFSKKIRIYENMKKDFIYMFAIYGSLIHKQNILFSSNFKFKYFIVQ